MRRRVVEAGLILSLARRGPTTDNASRAATIPWSDGEGTSAEAIGGLDLAYQIARHVGADTTNADRMFGRGSGCRAVVAAIKVRMATQDNR